MNYAILCYFRNIKASFYCGNWTKKDCMHWFLLNLLEQRPAEKLQKMGITGKKKSCTQQNKKIFSNKKKTYQPWNNSFEIHLNFISVIFPDNLFNICSTFSKFQRKIFCLALLLSLLVYSYKKKIVWQPERGYCLSYCSWKYSYPFSTNSTDAKSCFLCILLRPPT